MPDFALLIDIPLVVIAFVATLGGTLYRVFKTDQDFVPKTGDTARRVAFRLSIVAGLVGVSCYLVGIPFWFLAVVCAVLSLSLVAGDLLGFAGLPLFALVGFINEYVLGLPELVLSADLKRKTPVAEKETHEMVGRSSMTISPLRPQGEISIGGKSFPAASESCTIIDSGVPVPGVGSKNGNLLVTESASVLELENL